MEGIRDEGLLESALNRPVQGLQYEPKTPLPDLAAFYAYGLVGNHPFLGGNMRVSLMSAILFLEINGIRFFASEEEAILETLARLRRPHSSSVEKQELGHESSVSKSFRY